MANPPSRVIEVGNHEAEIKRKLSAAFWTTATIRFENMTRKTVRAPVLFKPITDPVNWTGYLLKEPSRMIDKHIVVAWDQKLVRLPADMMYVDLEVLRDS